MTQNDGGPAFPSPQHPRLDGMSLRDYFAGQALTGLIISAVARETGNGSTGTGTLAREAYEYAEAMLARRGSC